MISQGVPAQAQSSGSTRTTGWGQNPRNAGASIYRAAAAHWARPGQPSSPADRSGCTGGPQFSAVGPSPRTSRAPISGTPLVARVGAAHRLNVRGSGRRPPERDARAGTRGDGVQTSRGGTAPSLGSERAASLGEATPAHMRLVSSAGSAGWSHARREGARGIVCGACTAPPPLLVALGPAVAPPAAAPPSPSPRHPSH
eukprot:scaffold312_cov354-Prasinococcus_capsulatus_cf.AAC.6